MRRKRMVLRWRIGRLRSRVRRVQKPAIAVVLPPREVFSPDATGAVGLLARRLARAPSEFLPTVFGMAGGNPFDDVDFVPVRPALRLASFAVRYAAGVARRLAEKAPVLVEVHNRPEVALHLAKRWPVLLVFHNDPQGMRRARTRAERNLLLERLAGVATVSRFLRDRFVEGVGKPANVAVIPNCIDISETPPPPERECKILFAGRVVADKGADTFVRACALALPRLPGWRGVVLGADRFGPHSPDTPFLRALRPVAAAGGVELAGWRPHGDILAAMAAASIVVVPSRWPEPFGLTALEAMACGAPLLCSPRGGLPEVVGDAAVMIDPDNPETLADAIVALACDPARLAALSAAGRARAATFDVGKAAAALDALRRDVLAAWPRAPAHPI
jgi:UDP-glucose:(glucosyl)LPS alpha-1,2-glucosyltransferase